jgi:(1->4)-alpha-D-glucan 1-alpha-D-glucosylmutase
MMRIPVATYRLQFTPAFTFRDALEVVDYLRELGISDIYASPVFQARRGSTHGYDVVDMAALNPELGGGGDLAELAGKLGSRGMGWIQDIVPNHMSFDGENPFLMDLFEHGPRSAYAHFFDILWDHPLESLRGRLLTPFLGAPYDEILENREIRVHYGERGFFITCHDLTLPLRVETYADVLTRDVERLRETLQKDSPTLVKFLGVLYALEGLEFAEDYSSTQDRSQFIKRVLWELYSISADVRGHVDANLAAYNDASGDADAADLLDSLLSKQWFRLAYWKVAAEEVNYRRFFNINQLISLNVHEEDVFEATHSLVLRLVGEGKISGLRVDHIDGLRGPAAYLDRLRLRAGDIFIVVEKILAENERLPPQWPVEGTTGYDFLNALNDLFCESRNRRSLNKIYYAFTRMKASCETIVYESKKLIIETHMAGDIDNLVFHLKILAGRDRRGSDMTRQGLRRALVEIMACFPVYRTYVTATSLTVEDRRSINKAAERARERAPGLVHELNYIEKCLLLETFPEGEERADAFVTRFQQFTGPLMAKGVEDTSLYVYNRLISRNEVGGSPDSFGAAKDGFHRFNRLRTRLAPRSLNATSTHDTKRGEDARARINVLSEMPARWEKALKKWSRLNRPFKKMAHGGEIPDRNDEYLLYQTLLGSFESDGSVSVDYRERIRAFAVKAVREAKVHTAWIRPDTEYEEAAGAFIEAILEDKPGNRFLEDFRVLLKEVAFYGALNSLSQVLLKIASPGIPDFYQGSELWDLSLVDPDNRRPVDFSLRKAVLHEVTDREGRDPAVLARDLASKLPDHRIKMFLIRRALSARRERADLFREGDYIPLKVLGGKSRHVIAFARRRGARWALTAATRLHASLVEPGVIPCGPRVWSDTALRLPPGAPRVWHDSITGRRVDHDGDLPLAEVLMAFPCALLLDA